MSCTERGIDMTEDVFQASLDLVEDEGPIEPKITLGGGEPTLHKHFEDWLWRAIRRCYEVSCMWCIDEIGSGVYVVTNGSQTQIALNLAKMAKMGVIGAALSRDQWHDEIDEEVVKAFTIKRRPQDRIDYHDKRSINNSMIPMNVGRAKVTGVGGSHPSKDPCCCDTWTVDPRGGLRPCGCPGAPVLTNVFDPDWDVLNDWLDDHRDGEAHERWRREQRERRNARRRARYKERKEACVA
jgi:hypothetical protein